MDWIVVGQFLTLILAGIWLILGKFSQIYKRSQGEYRMTFEEFFWKGPKFMILLLIFNIKEWYRSRK